MNEKEYSVSEAVRRTGVPSHVLRYWEEELQISIRRSAQGYRVYTDSDLELFRRVKLLKERGIQLKAIRVLLEEQEDGQKGFQEQNLESKIREIVYQDQEQIDAAEPVYGIVLQQREPDHLHRFEMILKAMMEEVITEQNERLEQSLKECLRDELEEWYIEKYDEIYREAAAAAAPEKRSFWNWIRRNRQG